MHLKVDDYDPADMRYAAPRPVEEAQENLRVIREFMERSTKYSTFSGLSGVLAGLIAIAGCLVQYFALPGVPISSRPGVFLLNWSVVVVLAIGVDFLLTKRRAPLVGKTVVSRLGKQMVVASLPGLGTGALLTLTLLQRGSIDLIYPFWMLCYGVAVSAVGLFSQREVSRLGRAFLVAGGLTALLDQFLPAGSLAPAGLLMTAISFGGFHIAYGVHMSRRGGW